MNNENNNGMIFPQPINNNQINNEPMNPQPVNPMPMNNEPINPQPVNPTPMNNGQINPQPVNPMPINNGPMNPQPVNPTPMNNGPVNPQPVNPMPMNNGQINPQPVNPTPMNNGPMNTQQINPMPINNGPMNPQQINTMPINNGQMYNQNPNYNNIPANNNKKNNGIIFLIIGVVILIIIAVVALVLVLRNNDSKGDINNDLNDSKDSISYKGFNIPKKIGYEYEIDDGSLAIYNNSFATYLYVAYGSLEEFKNAQDDIIEQYKEYSPTNAKVSRYNNKEVLTMEFEMEGDKVLFYLVDASDGYSFYGLAMNPTFMIDYSDIETVVSLLADAKYNGAYKVESTDTEVIKFKNLFER